MGFSTKTHVPFRVNLTLVGKTTLFKVTFIWESMAIGSAL